MEKKITGYTTVDISQWHRKEHFEAFQSVAQCTYNQTVQLDITAFLKTVKKNKHKFYPAFIHILARLMNAHPELGPPPIPGSLWRASCPPPSGPLLRDVQIRSRRICPTQESVHRQTTDKTKGPVFRLSLSFYLMPGIAGYFTSIQSSSSSGLSTISSSSFT